jgi:VanZ family protein
MAAIFYESSQTKVPVLPAGLSNHTGHFLAYAVLAAAALRALAGLRWSQVTAGTAAAALVMASMYGVTDEFHQQYVANRSVGVDDWIADTAGALTAVVIALAIARRRRRQAASYV